MSLIQYLRRSQGEEQERALMSGSWWVSLCVFLWGLHLLYTSSLAICFNKVDLLTTAPCLCSRGVSSHPAHPAVKGKLIFGSQMWETWQKSCSCLCVIRYRNSFTLMTLLRNDWRVLLYAAMLGQHKAVLAIRVQYFPGPSWFFIPVKIISGVASRPLALFRIVWVLTRWVLLPKQVQISSRGFWISRPVPCTLIVSVTGLQTMVLCHCEWQYDARSGE